MIVVVSEENLPFRNVCRKEMSSRTTGTSTDTSGEESSEGCENGGGLTIGSRIGDDFENMRTDEQAREEIVKDVNGRFL